MDLMGRMFNPSYDMKSTSMPKVFLLDSIGVMYVKGVLYGDTLYHWLVQSTLHQSHHRLKPSLAPFVFLSRDTPTTLSAWKDMQLDSKLSLLTKFMIYQLMSFLRPTDHLYIIKYSSN